ncbi:MAG: OmpA family protein [candidate division WOR-3 bacterium]
MKSLAKFAAITVGILLMLTVVGCPKKCVKPAVEEPAVVEETTETVPVVEKPKVELSLQTIYFDFDKSDIRSGDARILQGNADQLKQALAAGQKPVVTIEGHCCPIGTAEYNMALGQRRAESAKAYLVKLGLDGSMFNTISYGEERLVTQDPARYELNRRCEFKVSQ